MRTLTEILDSPETTRCFYEAESPEIIIRRILLTELMKDAISEGSPAPIEGSLGYEIEKKDHQKLLDFLTSQSFRPYYREFSQSVGGEVTKYMVREPDTFIQITTRFMDWEDKEDCPDGCVCEKCVGGRTDKKDDKGLVSLAIFIVARTESLYLQLKELLDGLEATAPETAYALTKSSYGGLQTQSIGTVGTELVRENYPADILDEYDRIVKNLKAHDSTGRFVLCEGQPGCQPAGQKVLMADGSWRNIENIKMGDFVKSPQHDGTTIDAEVVDTLKYLARETFIVETTGSKNKIMYCASHNHILPIIELHHWKKNKQVYFESRLVEMTIDQYNEKSESWKKKARLFTSPAYELPEKDFPLDPYIVGCILGDGSLNTDTNNSFTFTKDSILEKMKSLGAEVGKISQDKRSKARSVRFLNGTNKAISKLLGIETSHTKKIPAIYMYGSLNQRLQLLAGLIDTDGTREEYSSTSEIMANQFKDLIFSIGGTASIHQRTTTCSGKSFKSFRVNYALAELLIPTILEYKRQSLRDMKWKNPRNHHFTVTPKSHETVYGFSLSGESQWYITNNNIVTHNTGKTYLLRGLIHELSGTGFQFIVVPTHLIPHIGDPDLIGYFINTKDKNKPRIFLLEDADSCLVARGTDNMPAISSLLNMTDGLIGSGLGFYIIATTNAEKTNIDDALLRPGRLLSYMSLREEMSLDHKKRIWYRITKKDEYPEDLDDLLTLADIYSRINRGVAPEKISSSSNYSGGSKKSKKQPAGFSR